MADIAFHQLFGSYVVTRAISRIVRPQNRLQKFWGFQPDGPNSDPVGGDEFGWDVFDRTRTIAGFAGPMAPPKRIAPNKVGHVSASAARVHESIFLQEGRVYRSRPLGGQWGDIDVRGQTYVAAQQEFLAQRVTDAIEFLSVGFMKGGIGMLQSGNEMIPVAFGAGNINIDFKIPAGNKTQGNMVGGGDIINTTWANAAADIPQDCLQINAAYEQMHGRPLRHVWCNSVVINNVMNNTKMQALAGTANRVFQRFDRTGEVNADGQPDTGFTVVFNAIPWLTFHVYDGGLDVNGTFTKFFGDTEAVFTTDPGRDIGEMKLGSEIVAESIIDPGAERFGLAGWVTRTNDPAGFEMKILWKGLPALYVPKCIAPLTVIF